MKQIIKLAAAAAAGACAGARDPSGTVPDVIPGERSTHEA